MNALFPPCKAVITTSPAPRMVAVAPLIVTIVALLLVKLTANPELAVATSVKAGLPYTLAGMLLKAIFCSVFCARVRVGCARKTDSKNAAWNVFIYFVGMPKIGRLNFS